jgi:hypothetical protein
MGGWAIGAGLRAAAHPQSSCAGALGPVCGLRLAACGLRLARLLAVLATGCWPLAGLWPVGETVACCVWRMTCGLWLVACGLLIGWLCCGLVVVAGLGLGLALALCMALYSILYRILDTGCQSSIFA